MAVETAGHLPKHKNILKPVAEVLAAVALTGLAITGGVAVKDKFFNNNSFNNVIVSEGFQDPPPLRVPDVIFSQQGELSTLKEYKDNWFNPGLTFELKDRVPDAPRMLYPNWANISGYLIATETNPDGSAMLAVEVPGKNGLFTQADIDTSPTSVDNLANNGNEGKISGAIVWVKVQNFAGFSLPFVSNSAWNQDFSSQRSNKSTNLPNELVKYVRAGDPVQIVADTHIASDAQELLNINYQQKTGNMPYEQALTEYSDLVDSNRDTIQRMLEDASKETASLRAQLTDKRYVLVARDINFVPSS